MRFWIVPNDSRKSHERNFLNFDFKRDVLRRGNRQDELIPVDEINSGNQFASSPNATVVSDASQCVCSARHM
jgi:hypothetical protein